MFRLYWILFADDFDECVGGCDGPVDHTTGVQPSFSGIADKSKVSVDIALSSAIPPPPLPHPRPQQSSIPLKRLILGTKKENHVCYTRTWPIVGRGISPRRETRAAF